MGKSTELVNNFESTRQRFKLLFNEESGVTRTRMLQDLNLQTFIIHGADFCKNKKKSMPLGDFKNCGGFLYSAKSHVYR